MTKTGLCELADRDPGAYAALRRLSQDRLPTRQELPEWCCAGGGCEAPCKGTRAFGLAEMMRHAHAKGSGASQVSDDEDDEVPVSQRLHGLLSAVLATVDPARFDIVLVELESNSGQRNIRGVREMLNASRMVQLPLAARSKAGHNELWVRHDASWLRDVRPTHHASHATNLSKHVGLRSLDRMVPFPALAEISNVALPFWGEHQRHESGYGLGNFERLPLP